MTDNGIPGRNESSFPKVIELAVELAAQWHDRTYRKGSWRPCPYDLPEGEVMRVPVMAHVTMVAMMVQRAGWDDATVAAAFLHDAIEDANCFRTYLTYERLCEMIGDEVAGLVRDVTEVKFDADGQPRTWRQRKEDYLAGLAGHSAAAVAISLADKLHNLWTMNESLAHGIDIFTGAPDRKALNAGPADQLWFHCEVLELSGHHGDPRLDSLKHDLNLEIERFKQLTGART